MHRQTRKAQPKAATRLSRRSPVESGFARLFRVARESLLWLSVMFVVSSCIVADPPQFTDPVQTPPELNGYLASPPLSQVVTINTMSSGSATMLVGPTFTVPVRSEDAGVDLVAIFWQDYGSSSQRLINSQSVSASTYNDTGRSITSLPYTVDASLTGCHTVSLVVAHITSFEQKNNLQLDLTKAKTDAAIVTWWVNVDPSPDNLTTLVNCPTQTP